QFPARHVQWKECLRMSMRVRLKRHLAVASALTLGLALAACAKEEEAQDSAKPETVRVAVSGKIAYYIPYLIEPYWGEFKKQGIAIEMEYGPAPDTLVLLTQGRVDAMITGPSANILNAAAQNVDLKLVAPGGIEPDDSPNGWYVSKDRKSVEEGKRGGPGRRRRLGKQQ